MRATCRALAVLAALSAIGAGESPRWILLGTAGGPTPKKSRAAPSQVLEIGGSLYVVDCGNGVARQLVLAGLSLSRLRHVFVTHHHSDHVADLVTLPMLAWAAGLESPVTLHGPRPLRRAVKDGLRAVEFDRGTRESDEGRPPLDSLVRSHEIRGDGVVFRDDRVTVRAARVEHPPIDEAYAYRFDTAQGSVVISGDTRPSQGLVRLARGADLLVHEVLLLDPPEVAAWISRPLDDPLVRHIVESHTSYRDVGRIAREAGVRKLVLSHFVPGDAEIDRARVVAEIRKSFDGEIVFGQDLLALPLE